MFGKFSLAGNCVATLHLATCLFLERNHLLLMGNRIKSKKEHENIEKFKRRNPGGKGRRENFNENQRKAERKRARNKTFLNNN